MKNKTLINNLNKWREQQNIKRINTNKITVSHQEHLQTDTIDFRGRLDTLSYAKGKVVPIVVRKTDGGFQLLFGLKQLIIAKLTNHNRMPAIIVECTREELVKYLVHDYSSGDWYKLDDIVIQNSFAETRPSPRKVKQKKKQINKGLVPKITVNNKGVLLDGYITYLILKEKGIKDVLVEIVGSAKAKSYRLKDDITSEHLLNIGFEEGYWNYKDGECVSKRVQLMDSMKLELFIKTNPVSFNDFENVMVMDSAFGQPYTPFYGDNYKQMIDGGSYLTEVVERYNEVMDGLNIFEEVI